MYSGQNTRCMTEAIHVRFNKCYTSILISVPILCFIQGKTSTNTAFLKKSFLFQLAMRNADNPHHIELCQWQALLELQNILQLKRKKTIPSCRH